MVLGSTFHLIISFTIRWNVLPKTISYVDDSILNEIISCKTQDNEKNRATYLCCVTAFRVIPAELQFYKKMNLPIPQYCLPCRLQDRLNRRNPRKLWKRKCMCNSSHKLSAVSYNNTLSHIHGNNSCSNEFETSHPPDSKQIVYCEECYNKEIA